VRTPTRVVAAVLTLAGGVPTLVSGQCPDGSAPPCATLVAPLDTTRYAVLPFAHREESQQATLDGAACAELLAEAFARWTEVRLADKTRLYDALARRRERLPFRIPFDSALAIARRLGAGKLVMGQLWSFGDTLRLTAGLYDAARGGALVREVTTRVPAHSDGIGAAFNALADSLLGAGPGVTTGAGADQTRSLRALRAYAIGERAIREWDLVRAAHEFRAAVAADSTFARAYLELGQALLWAADSTPDGGRDRTVIARRTADLLGKLGNTDGVLLLAQQAMFEQRWPDACRQFREILAADSASFAAWYGLAECNAGDGAVIPYPADTTRFTFRGSYETAMQAYRRALLLAPAFNLTFGRRAIDRLPALLLAEQLHWRRGIRGEEPYYGFPELEGDTMAFYAAPGTVVAAGHRPPTQGAAIARNRVILVEVANSFLAAFPDEPGAHRAVAHALEVTGRLVPEVGASRSALTEFAAAQRLEREPRRRARDAADRVRALLKAGEFGVARLLGDSLLRVARRPTDGVAGVAVLLGRPALASKFFATEDTAWLAGSADNAPVAISLPAARAGLVLLAYAAVGAPAESIRAYERRLEDLLAGVPTAHRAATRSALLDVPAELVFDTLGLRPAHRIGPPGPHRAMLLHWSLAHGDTALVRASLDSLARARGGSLATGGSTPDDAYVSARLLLAVGDTDTAARTLDAPLDSLVALHTATLQYLPLAGCLVRMMALRADLAAAQGDWSTARRWASAVSTLWGGAEPALQPIAVRMSRIVQAAH